MAEVADIPQLLGQPDNIKLHMITDEELTMLEEYGNGFYSGLLWVALGATLGSAKTFVDCVSLFQSQKVPTGAELVEGSLFLVAITTLLLCVVIVLKGRNKLNALVERIRSRKETEID